MGILSKLFQRNTKDFEIVSCRNLCEEYKEFAARKMAFQICVDLIANAMSLCKFRTFSGNIETKGAEFWLWNFEPNVNQNAEEFIKKAVQRLLTDGEVLIFSPRKKDGSDMLAVADSFNITEYVSKQNEYSDVVCGNLEYNKVFKEENVLHIKFQNERINSLKNQLLASYEKVISSALEKEAWNNGQHWKVHINQVAQNTEQFEAKFRKMMQEQVKPFFEIGNTVLPEFDGYSYTRESVESGADLIKQSREMVEDIFNLTARSFLIPAVLVNGKLEQTKDANQNFLTYVIDPLAKMFEQEIIRKRYEIADFQHGDFLHVDTSAIIHFDLFENAANVEKVVGSACYTINDIRESAGQVRINEGWADAHYLTKNIGTVEALERGEGN